MPNQARKQRPKNIFKKIKDSSVVRVNKNKESRSEPSKRAGSSKTKVFAVAICCQEMTVEQAHRFNAATDALLTEIVRQEMGRAKPS